MRRILRAIPIFEKGAKHLDELISNLEHQLVRKDCEMTTMFFVNNSSVEFVNNLRKKVPAWEVIDLGEIVEKAIVEVNGKKKLFRSRSKFWVMATVRNKIREYALEHGYDYVYMQDADTIVGNDVLTEMLPYFTEGRPTPDGKTIKDVGLVNVLGFKRGSELKVSDKLTYQTPAIYIKSDDIKLMDFLYENVAVNGVTKPRIFWMQYLVVTASGMSGTMFSREILEKVAFDTKLTSMFQFIEDAEEEKKDQNYKGTSETFAYSKAVTALGYKVLVLPQIFCKHLADEK